MTPAEIIARELPPITDRGLAGQLMDAAWPLYGGDMQPAEFWNDFGEGIRFAVESIQAAGIRMERDDPVTTVYGRLLRRHMDALRKGDEPRREKLFAAIEILRGEYPAECQVWEDRYDPAIRALTDGGGSE